ncbi:MAG: hypothetical protein WA579_03005 [Rhodomicrobium sp.]
MDKGLRATLLAAGGHPFWWTASTALPRDAVALISMTAALILNANLAVAGMALSGIAMGAAALGQLAPVAAAITQEGIDVLVILNALRALFSGKRSAPRGLAISSEALREDHHTLEKGSIACAKLQTPWTTRTESALSPSSRKPTASCRKASSNTNAKTRLRSIRGFRLSFPIPRGLPP